MTGIAPLQSNYEELFQAQAKAKWLNLNNFMNGKVLVQTDTGHNNTFLSLFGFLSAEEKEGRECICWWFPGCTNLNVSASTRYSKIWMPWLKGHRDGAVNS